MGNLTARDIASDLARTYSMVIFEGVCQMLTLDLQFNTWAPGRRVKILRSIESIGWRSFALSQCRISDGPKIDVLYQ